MEYKKPDLKERITRKIERIIARRFARTPLYIPDDFRGITFCFDDFPAITTHTAAKMLEEANTRGSFYTCFGILEDTSDSGKLADIQTVRDIAARGHEIGCHTYDHILCTGENASRIAETCARNRAAATEQGITLETFAYPEGEICLPAKKTIKQHYRAGRTVSRGINKGWCDAHTLMASPLYECPDETNTALIEQVRNNGGWLIFITHDVQDPPSQYGTSIACFRNLLSLAQKYGIPIRTIAQTLDLIQNARK